METTSESDLIKAAIERVAVKEQRVREAYEAGIDTLDEYKGNRLRLSEEREELMEQLENLSPAVETEDPGPDVVMERIRTLYDLISDHDVDNETKGNAVRRVVKKIILDRVSGEFRVIYYA